MATFQLMHVIYVGTAKPDPDRRGYATIDQERIDAITKLHPKLLTAAKEIKLLPRRGGTSINMKSFTEIAKTVLASCTITLNKLIE